MYNEDEFSRIEELMKGQSDILQMIFQGKPLPVVLERLVDWVEAQSTDNLIASILCADEEGTRLYHCAGSRLPKAYVEAISGLQIGPEVGSCGTAGFRKEQVVVENIEDSILWKDYKDIALQHNLRACWSTPLLNNQGKLRGTFAVYYQVAKRPETRHFQLISLVAHTALLAIEFKVAEEERLRNSEREKLVRENLERSEQRFQNLVRDAPIGIIVLHGEEMRVDIVNEMYGKLIEQTPEQLLGKPLFTIIPHARETFEPILNDVRTTGKAKYLYDQPYHVVVEGKEISGFLNVIYQPYKEFDGKISGVIALCHDVTEQVEARKLVEESEERVRSFVESAPFPIGVYVGREMRIQFANKAVKDIWGKGNELEGRLYADVLPELAGQKIYEQLDDVFTTGIPFHARNQQVDIMVDNVLQTFYFNYSFTPLFDKNGSIYGVVNTGVEVTEIVVAYKKLEESEETARLAIEASEQGTFHVDLKTNEIKASARLAEIFDVENDSDRQRYISAIHPEDLSIREKAYEKAWETTILDYEARIIKKDGFIIWIRIKGKFYFNDKNEPERILGISQDITEQRNFAETLTQKVKERTIELQHANKQLREYNDELEQFAYISSHDLQEPLRKIRIFSDLLTKQVKDDGDFSKYLQKINASAHRMAALIQSLLEYSRITNVNLRFEKVDLNSIIDKILVDFELLIQEKNAIVNINILPEIDGIPLQMNQLFYNLIGNALKFTQPGVQPIITVDSQALGEAEKATYAELNKNDEYTSITVEDNGIGFDKAFSSKIFTVFQRLNNRSDFEGYGVGLALCKKVVQTHKGFIYAKGEPKKGARFIIILPTKALQYHSFHDQLEQSNVQSN